MENIRNIFLWAAEHPAVGALTLTVISYTIFQLATLCVNYIMFRYPDDVLEKMKREQPLKAALVIMWKSISVDTQKTIESGTAISKILSKAEKKENDHGESV